MNNQTVNVIIANINVENGSASEDASLYLLLKLDQRSGDRKTHPHLFLFIFVFVK